MVLVLRLTSGDPSRHIPQTSLFQLLLRHFQALPTPQPIDPFDVHRKSLVPKESTDLTITEPGKLPDQFQHPLHQRRFIVGDHRLIALAAAGLIQRFASPTL